MYQGSVILGSLASIFNLFSIQINDHNMEDLALGIKMNFQV
jgi:hypothetical protein